MCFRRIPSVAALALLVACSDHCGTRKNDEATPAVTSEAPQATPDPLQDRLHGIRQGVGALPPIASSADPTAPPGPEREGFRENARALGEDAIGQGRADVAAEVGRVLIDAGETRLAEAFLQRAVGLMKPADGKKDHIYPLAQLKRAAGRPLEAASLYERAIDAEPTAPMEFVGLSDLYLAAGRMGPARAAVTRGLAKHADARPLLVQGAKVELLGGDPAKALAAIDGILAQDAQDLAARLVRLEALLAAGRLEEGQSAAAALTTQLPDNAWGHIYTSVIARAKGDTAASDAGLARARDIAGACPCTHEERLAIQWAEGVQPGTTVPARARTEPSQEGLAP
jgi:tetratricopeptide (TPR) repeat protein